MYQHDINRQEKWHSIGIASPVEWEDARTDPLVADNWKLPTTEDTKDSITRGRNDSSTDG